MLDDQAARGLRQGADAAGSLTRAELIERLGRGGFVAAEEEADELLACGGDLGALVARRETGEPLAWITGSAVFCGVTVLVRPGVYVPRWQSEPVAHAAVAALGHAGVAIDLCTGSGAIARVLAGARPRARVVATESDGAAAACARANGVEVFEGDLFDPLPPGLRADVVVGVVPYVPTPELALLQRDTFTFETPLSYDGGPDGLAVLLGVLETAPARLRPGGTVVLECGGDQPALLAPHLKRLGYETARTIGDDDGRARGVAVTRRA